MPPSLCIVLPVVLMLVRAIVDIIIDNPDDGTQKVFDVIGDPVVALLAGVLVAMWVLGFRSGHEPIAGGAVRRAPGLPAIAGILLIVAAGGGFKQMLVDAGVGSVIGDWANGSGISPLVLGWLVAVGVRLATGSATVATITASGIVAGIATDLPSSEVSLLVLAIGCGSLFFSHVNDAGFWLVKEYFGLTVGQTIRSWSVMETAISVVGLPPGAGAQPGRLAPKPVVRPERRRLARRHGDHLRIRRPRRRVGGSGPDVLLVHAGVTDQRSWARVVDALPGHRCLTYDARGYGRTTYEPEDGWSPVSTTRSPSSMPTTSGAAVVIGASMGGRTSIDLALAHPDRVRALVLIGPAISGAPEATYEPEVLALDEEWEAAEERGDLATVNRLEARVWLDGPTAAGGPGDRARPATSSSR